MKLRPIDIFLKSGKNTTAENCLICLAVSLLGTFFYYEYSFESRAKIHTPLTWLIAAAIFVLWIKCALLSGRDKKFGFAVFAFLYWGLPFLYMLFYSGRDNVRGYNKWLAMTNRIAGAIELYPFADQAGKLGISPQTVAVILLLMIMAAFAAGFFIKYRYDRIHSKDRSEQYDADYVIDDDSPVNETTEAIPDDAPPPDVNG